MRTSKLPLVLSATLLLIAGLAGRAGAVPPPAPWVPMNIGPSLAAGAVDLDPRGFWTIRASNGDVGQSTDSFFFVSQPLSGDGSIIALLLGQEGGDPQWGKAGIMIRAGEHPSAPNIHLHMTSSHGLALTYRAAARAVTINEGADRRYGARQFPVWLRLQREGDRFTPFSSTDGFGWAQLHAPITLPGFPKDALVGLTAASLFDAPVSAAFGNVTVFPGQVSPIVQVASGNASALLSWTPVSNAVGYLVRRSAPNTPGFAADMLTPQPIGETTFSDTNVPNGKPVRYLVSAVLGLEEGTLEGWPTAVVATPVPTPGNLLGTDLELEATQLRGSVVYDPATGIYKISGSGGDIGDTADRGYFAAQFVRGDFQVTARLLEKTAKAGLMMRESLAGGSRMAFVAGTFANGVFFQYREETGGGTIQVGKPVITDANFKPPLLMRLVRSGNTITAFVSPDGTTFVPAGAPKSFDPPLPESLYVGIAITAGNAGNVLTTSFSDFAISPP
jgi:hypothetical protein